MKFLVDLCIFINICLLCLPHKSFCKDERYEVCKKVRYCGNQTIQFPFYTEDITAYCGFPGFELTCINNNSLLFNISPGNQYRVDEIFYNNDTLRVSNVFSICSLSNISDFYLPNDSLLELLSSSSLILFSNCTAKAAQEFAKNKVGCNLTENDQDWILALKNNNTIINNTLKTCKNVAIAPVNDFSEDDDTDYLQLVRNGFGLKWTATSCSDCKDSGGYCGYYAEPVFQFMCFCSDRPHPRACNSSSRRRKIHIRLGLGTLAAGVLITAVLLYCFWSRCLCSKYTDFSESGRKDHRRVKAFLKLHGNLSLKRFRYQDIKKMTQSFKYKLGQGGYGGVYKGKLADGRAVAVKILNNLKSDGEEFLNEVASISRTYHLNIVSLLGFCFEGPERALVYEFMPNGSLEKFISHRKSSAVQQLEWKTLAKIAVGIARGLEYLHRGCSTQILHFDIKPHNILLDEEFCPKISDFGLAKLCSGRESIISMHDMRGTPGYIAPEVYSRNFGGVSHKSDVYSYGMMILEMVGAKDNINKEANNCSSEKYFPDWIYDCLELNVDVVVVDDISNEVECAYTRKMMIVGLWCIQTHPSSRPSMKRVLEMLEQNLESLQIPPKPFLHSFQEPAETFSTNYDASTLNE